MSYVTILLNGYNLVENNGAPLPQRSILNFIGATVSDNPANGSTDVTVGTGSGLGGITQLVTDVIATGPGIAPAEVAGIRSRSVANTAPVDGSFLIFGNPVSTWSPTLISGDAAVDKLGELTVTAVQNYPVSTTAPTSGQVLKWDGSYYVPAADANGIGQLTGDVTAGPGTGAVDATVAKISAAGLFPLTFTPAATWIQSWDATVTDVSLRFGSNEIIHLNVANLAIALGYSSTATQNYSVALGAYLTSSGAGSVCIGENSTSSGANSTALGYASVASGTFAAALGSYCYGYGVNSTALGVQSAANLAGELSHASGHTGAQGLHAWDVDKALVAAPGNLLLVDGNEITIASDTLLSMSIRVSGCIAGMTKVASEVLDLLIATPAGASVITGPVSVRTVGQSLASQGWSVTVSIVSINTLRISCNPGSDTVRFFARVETSQVTP